MDADVWRGDGGISPISARYFSHMGRMCPMDYVARYARNSMDHGNMKKIFEATMIVLLGVSIVMFFVEMSHLIIREFF